MTVVLKLLAVNTAGAAQARSTNVELRMDEGRIVPAPFVNLRGVIGLLRQPRLQTLATRQSRTK